MGGRGGGGIYFPPIEKNSHFDLDNAWEINGSPSLRERPPGSIQHLLTVLGFLVLGAAPTPASTFVAEPHPKDPAVLKTLQDSELLRRSVFTTPSIFTTM